MSRNFFNWVSLLRAPSNLTLNVSRDGASTTSLGNLFQCFTTLIVKNFFFISSLNLPSFSLNPLPLALLQQALLKSLFPSLLQAPLKYWKAAVRSPRSLLLFRLNSPNSLSFSSQERAPALGSSLWPPLAPLQQLHVLLVLRAWELDTGVLLGSHQSGAEGQNLLPWPAGNAAFQI